MNFDFRRKFEENHVISIDLGAKTILDRILELFSIRNSQKLLVQLGTLKATADLTLVISGKMEIIILLCKLTDLTFKCTKYLQFFIIEHRIVSWCQDLHRCMELLDSYYQLPAVAERAIADDGFRAIAQVNGENNLSFLGEK